MTTYEEKVERRIVRLERAVVGTDAHLARGDVLVASILYGRGAVSAAAQVVRRGEWAIMSGFERVTS